MIVTGYRLPLARLGLASDFLGAVVVAFSGYFGLVGGFGGPIVWSSTLWKMSWWLGWAFLAFGFLLQWIVSSADKDKKGPREMG